MAQDSRGPLGHSCGPPGGVSPPDPDALAEELRSGVGFCQALVQSLPVFFVAIGADGRTITMNEALLGSLGYSKDEVEGADYLSAFVPEAERREVEEVFRRLTMSGAPTINENGVLTKEGDRLLVEWHGRPVLSEPGDLSFFFGIGIDITDRDRAERELEESNRHLAAMNSLMIRLNSLEVNLDGRAALLKALREATGASLASLTDFDSTSRELVVSLIDAKPDAGPRFEEALGSFEGFRASLAGDAEAALLRETVRPGMSLTEVSFGAIPQDMSDSLHKDLGIAHFVGLANVMDGRLYGTIVLGMAEGQPELPDDLLSSLAHTTTVWLSRWRAEEHLRESEERYRLIAENVADTISVYDLNMHCTYVSPSVRGLRGFTPEEAMAQDLSEVLTPRSLAQVMRVFREEMELEASETADPARTRTMEVQQYRKDGSLQWVENKFSYLRDSSGRPTGILALSRDITDRKRAEEEQEKLQAQLLQAQKMESVGRLAGGVAHDFNNMLHVIIGHAELAMESMDEAHPLSQSLEEIRLAARRSAELTGQLLAFARKQTVSPRVLDLNETVEGMLRMLARLIGEDIDITWLPGKDLWPIKVDPSQLDQILANLCVNARDAIGGVGAISISTHSETIGEGVETASGGEASPGDYVVLAVRDNGCGMTPEVLASIFDPFFTTKEVGKGTGLGLPMIYGITLQNNGFVRVQSEPGTGSTFEVLLPRRGAPAPAEAHEEPTLQKLSPGEETVLLVEDEPAILKLATRMLQRQGYTILPAATPGEAMAMAREHPGEIHLLITDVVMPEMNGRQLATEVQSLHPGIRRLFMSGYPADVIAHHGVLEQGVHFLQKPFTSATFLSRVRSALED